MSCMINLYCEGNLIEVFQTLSFLNSKKNGVTVFYPAYPQINQIQFPTEDYSATTYSPCREDVPSKAPAPADISFTMTAFVDSDHADDSVSLLS